MYAETIIDGGRFSSVLCDNLNDFNSGKCCDKKNDVSIMGEKVDRTLRGKYYLKTKRAYPFVLPTEMSINCKR